VINVTRLLGNRTTPGDYLRYSETGHRRPVVVWNITGRCNLRCVHCYAGAGERASEELATAEARKVIADLAEYGVPVVLFSGGEPLMREDILELVRYAASLGIRPVLSTNGTLISKETARRLKEAGVAYVGVSLDGVEAVNDRFRGKPGAFREALAGLRHCREAGLRTGVRFTLTRFNAGELPALFRLIEEENIERICFYHLVYAGRGSRLVSQDLSPEETRRAVDLIFDSTLDLLHRGHFKDVLTVDNHADGIYLYLRVRAEEPERAPEVYRFLELNGGNSSGIGIGAIDERGEVHPDQFWRHCSLGNVREWPFSAIWEDGSSPLLAALRNRETYLKGRCRRCRFLRLCRGNFRVRAEAVYGDVWAPDPACYLNDREVGIDN